jgi:hypothetical protein
VEPCNNLNDGDIVDYIMLCAGAGVTGGCKEIYRDSSGLIPDMEGT